LVVEAPGSAPQGVSEPTSYSGGEGPRALLCGLGGSGSTAVDDRARFVGERPAPSNCAWLSRPPFWGVDFGPVWGKARALLRKVDLGGFGWSSLDRAPDAPASQEMLAWDGTAWSVAGSPARASDRVPQRPFEASAGDGEGCGRIASGQSLQLASRGSAASRWAWSASRSRAVLTEGVDPSPV
jgi:hypothetical protein